MPYLSGLEGKNKLNISSLALPEHKARGTVLLSSFVSRQEWEDIRRVYELSGRSVEFGIGSNVDLISQATGYEYRPGSTPCSIVAKELVVDAWKFNPYLVKDRVVTIADLRQRYGSRLDAEIAPQVMDEIRKKAEESMVSQIRNLDSGVETELAVDFMAHFYRAFPYSAKEYIQYAHNNIGILKNELTPNVFTQIKYLACLKLLVPNEITPDVLTTNPQRLILCERRLELLKHNQDWENTVELLANMAILMADRIEVSSQGLVLFVANKDKASDHHDGVDKEPPVRRNF